MSISAAIVTAYQSLQAQIASATPLLNASQPARTALKLNAASLVASVQSALTASSVLDGWTAPPDAPSMILGVENLATAADDQSNLSVMRGVLGRVASNLDQLP